MSTPPVISGFRKFWPALLVLLSLAIVHTLWATSLDSFTGDEPYHIAAGASYLRFGDFRVNPEHPPLVKLVAGLFQPRSVLHLDPPGIVQDKSQERVYTQTAVFLNSDYHAVQRHSRTALILLNTLLLALLTLALRRVFSPAIALATLLLLALDPTVCAHMPVVMTDLPMALLGTLSTALAILAIRCRRWRDWLLFGLSLGFLLATKHSAPLILIPLVTGCFAVLLWKRFKRADQSAGPQLVRLAAATVLAVLVLWSTYGFRFHESPRDASGQYTETFNRSLNDKIADLHSPLFRKSLTFAEHAHLLPRAYIWGLADTLRAGVESRPIPITAFRHDYAGKAPGWVAFAFLIVKLPLAFLALAIAGIVLFLLRRFPPPVSAPLSVFLGMFVFFMAFIAKNGVFYAGLRHWLFTVPLLAITAAACMIFCWNNKHLAVRLLPVAAVLIIAITVLPQRRIWEFHNLIAGGSANAWKEFDNESVDLGQRSDEILAFCKKNVSPSDPFIGYWMLREQMQANHIKKWVPTPEQVGDGHLNGWFVFNASGLPSHNWEGVEAFKDATPVATFGIVHIYHGSFFLPLVGGGILANEGFHQLHLPHGDLVKAEAYFRRGLELNPRMWPAAIEVANFDLQRNNTAEALAFYQLAKRSDRATPEVQDDIQHQIDLVKAGSRTRMRNPADE